MAEKKAKFESQALNLARQIVEERSVREDAVRKDVTCAPSEKTSPQSAVRAIVSDGNRFCHESPKSEETPLQKHRRLEGILGRVVEEFWKTDANGEYIVVEISSRTCDWNLDDVDGIFEKLKECCKSGPAVMPAQKGAQPPPGYRRVRHGITRDRGSNVDIVPAEGDPDFEIREPTGPRIGKRLCAANGGD